jgi:chloramphenicol-sensitive protein RarD
MSETAASKKPVSAQPREPLSGFAYALGAYLLWGGLPFYMKAVATSRPMRSSPTASSGRCRSPGVILFLLGRTADLRAALRSPRTLALAALTAGLISINWGIYVWAVAADRTLETALGYYINPLVNVVLGAVFLGERFNRLQATAIALAVIAVAILTVKAGGLPWVSLALACRSALRLLPQDAADRADPGLHAGSHAVVAPALAIIGWLAAHGHRGISVRPAQGYRPADACRAGDGASR